MLHPDADGGSSATGCRLGGRVEDAAVASCGRVARSSSRAAVSSLNIRSKTICGFSSIGRGPTGDAHEIAVRVGAAVAFAAVAGSSIRNFDGECIDGIRSPPPFLPRSSSIRNCHGHCCSFYTRCIGGRISMMNSPTPLCHHLHPHLGGDGGSARAPCTASAVYTWRRSELMQFERVMSMMRYLSG